MADIGFSLGSFFGRISAGFEKARQISRREFLGVAANADSWELPGVQSDVPHQRALINSWVFSALADIIGEVCATPLSVIRQGSLGNPIRIDHPLEALIEKPNPFMTRVFLWAYTIMWMKLEGNSYWFLSVNTRTNQVQEIWPLPSNEVTPVPSEDPRVFLSGYTYSPGGREFFIPREFILHIKNLPNPTNFFLGLAELDAAKLAVSSDTAMSAWNESFYSKDHVMPSAIINFSSGNPRVQFPKADLMELKAELNEQYSAAQRRTLVTTAQDVSVEQLGWAARDLDFIKGREFTRREILEIFGIPEGLNSAQSTEANARIAYRRLQDTVYTRTMVVLANYITTGILWPFYGTDVQASFGEIRPAIQEMALLELDRVKGVITINEARERYLRMPPLPSELGAGLFTGSNPEGGRPQVSAESFDGAGTNSNVQQELRRWREKSLKALQAGRPASVKFSSDIIPGSIQDLLRLELEEVEDFQEVKSIFARFSEACSRLQSLEMI